MGMDGMVEENGTSSGATGADALAGGSSSGTGQLVAVTRIVQLALPTQAPSVQVFPVVLSIYSINHW